jgi:Putative SAM-dependent methyltransferase
MTIFELVKLALDELYAEGTDEYGSGLDKQIKKQMAYLTDKYRNLDQASQRPVSYKDPATRFAYVYKYVAAHADYLVQVMNMVKPRTGGLFGSRNVRISCVGGGPGSDIIASLKYLDQHKRSQPVEQVTCYLLDREQAWADTWTELKLSLRKSVDLNANFQPLDVTDRESWKSQKKFLKADLFTLSFFVSEVFGLDSDGVVSAFWKTLFDNAVDGSRFIYTDNGHVHFNDYFDRQWKDAGLRCIQEGTNVRMVPRVEEEKSSLGDYLDKFGHAPKLQGTITFRVLEKS